MYKSLVYVFISLLILPSISIGEVKSPLFLTPFEIESLLSPDKNDSTISRVVNKGWIAMSSYLHNKNAEYGVDVVSLGIDSYNMLLGLEVWTILYYDFKRNHREYIEFDGSLDLAFHEYAGKLLAKKTAGEIYEMAKIKRIPDLEILARNVLTKIQHATPAHSCSLMMTGYFHSKTIKL